MLSSEIEDKYIKTLESKLKPALGCTEPIAIALAGAIAGANSKGDWIEGITVKASGNIIKNAMSVIIPGTRDTGVKMAVTLGVLAKNNSKLELEVLKDINQEMIDEAKRLVDLGLIKLELANTEKKLYIEVELKTSVDRVRTIIEDGHTNLTLIEVDDQEVFHKDQQVVSSGESQSNLDFMTLDGIIEFANKVDLEYLGIIEEAITMNYAIANEGLKGTYGLGVGKMAYTGMSDGVLGEGIANRAIALTAAGSDARMAGAMLACMSNSGSGNQGITATMPVVAVGEKLGLDGEKIIRGVTLSNLFSIYIKERFGVLSALCGATVAATGASAGITYILGGDSKKIKMSVKNMIGNLGGIICDGAKPGCALKVANCAGSAVNSALLAIKGQEIHGDEGIVADTAEATIDNYCRISRECSGDLDKVILDIMVSK